MTGVKVIDRLTGAEVDAPTGRALLGRFAFVDGDRQLIAHGGPAVAGQYLASGPGQWALSIPREARHAEGDFGHEPLPNEVTVDTAIAIGKQVAELADRRKPLAEMLKLPPLLHDAGSRLRRSTLEKTIDDGLGHLRGVCHRPITRLRPAHELLPVSRARRITPRTVQRLSAHSEDWARLRPDGVRPERVLSPVHDVDLDLYENRVASRLVDHLWSYVNRRIVEIRNIEWMLADVKRLQTDIASRPWRSREHLFGLFADFVESDAWQARAAERISELEGLRHGLASLLDSPLRRGVNQRAEISTVIRSTNVFANDERYRRIGEMWRTWVDEQTGAESAEEQLERVQRWCRGFESYVALLIIRAVDQLGLRPDPGQSALRESGPPLWYRRGLTQVTVSWEPGGVFCVRTPEKVLLRLVPLPHALTGTRLADSVRVEIDQVAVAPVDALTLVLYPADRDERADLPDALQVRVFEGPEAPRPGRPMSQPYLMPVSPLEIDSVTRLARSLRFVIEDQRICDYPKVVACERAEARAIAGRAPWMSVGATGVAVTSVPTSHELHEARSSTMALRVGTERARQLGGNAERVERLWNDLEEAARDLVDLTTCPVCTKTAPRPERALTARRDGTYRCECVDCHSVWESRRCRTCQSLYPVLITKPSGAAPDASPSTSGAHDRSRGDVLDRTVGSDLLSAPCWVGDRIFICPRCSSCNERARDSTPCARCS